MKKENRQKAIELAKKAEEKEELKSSLERALQHVDVEPITLVKYRGLYVPIRAEVLRAELEASLILAEGELFAFETELDKL